MTSTGGRLFFISRLFGLQCLLSSPFLASAQPPPLAWVQRYSGPAQHSDTPAAITSDNAGNVYVAGSSLAEKDYDFVTIKYSSGVPVWTNRFDGSGNGDDSPVAIAVDAGGNVFVTGSTDRGNGSPSFATIKYNAAGMPLWTNWGTNMIPSAMILDNAGNVLVAGSYLASDPELFIVDQTMCKISAAGVSLWTNIWNTSTNGGTVTPNALGVDANNDVFVTATMSFLNSPGSLTYYEGSVIDTVAFSSAGAILWTNLYETQAGYCDSAVAMSVATSGNIVVTGNSENSVGVSSMVTRVYSPSGSPLWTGLVAGTPDYWQFANAVAFDSSGNVFVAGYSYNTCCSLGTSNLLVKYASTGAQRWINQVASPALYSAITADSAGHIFLTSGPLHVFGYEYPPGTNQIFGTSEISTLDFLITSNFYSLPLDALDYGAFISQQPNGNAFILGASLSPAGEPELETAALVPSTGVLWTNDYVGPGASHNSLTGLAVNTNGEAVLTGYSSTQHTATLYATLAYSTAGQPLWTNSYRGLLGSQPTSAVSDGQGGLVATGLGAFVDNPPFATVDYSATGLPQWTNYLVTPGGSSQAPPSPGRDGSSLLICVNAGTNFFLSQGLSSGTFLTFRLSPSGTSLWTNSFSNANTACYPYGIAADAVGDVFVTGTAYVSSNFQNHFTVTAAYSAAGLPLWTNFSPNFTTAGSQAIGVTSNGTVIVTMSGNLDCGTNQSCSNPGEIETIAYSTAGAALWTNISGASNSTSLPIAVAIDPSGNAVIAGDSYSSGFMILKLSPGGVSLWTNISSLPRDAPEAMALDHLGNIFVTGLSYNGVGNDIVTAAFSPAGTLLWTNRYDDPASSNDAPVAIAVKGADVYVAGNSTASDGSSDYLLLKYSPNLQPLSVQITPVNVGAVLTWTNSLFGLQSATSANGPFADILGASSPYTSPLAAPGLFFRLKSE